MTPRRRCPDCGSQHLLSIEPAFLEYPVLIGDDSRPDYTGESYIVDDEGTSFAGELACRACQWHGVVDQLTAAA